jgi:very-short-patch-repair endonuclease
MPKKITTKDFIEKAKQVHGDKYDYSKVNYINSETPITIICHKHGEYICTPHKHLQGRKCRKCANEEHKLTTKDFIEKARKMHGDKYDYSKVNYIDSRTAVCIICPEHGEFWQVPTSHLSGKGCGLCAGNKLTEKMFIEKAKQVHGDKYDYSKVEYKGCKTKVCIICPEHGEFWQSPNNHLNGNTCPKCSKISNLEKIKKKSGSNLETFIEKARKMHGDKYDYSKVKYTNNNTPVCIICPEHGEFWQKPNKHLQGHNCPICNESKLEEKTRLILKENNILFESQKKFDWLGRKSLDFYLPDYNIAIECQGRQHFIASSFFGGKTGLKETKQRDDEKLKLCKQNGIKIIYFNYNEKIESFKTKLQRCVGAI